MKTETGPEEGGALPTVITSLIEVAVTTTQEKLMSDPVLVDAADCFAIARSFLILSAPSGRQVRAIAEGILDRVKTECGVKTERIEGRTGNRWILIDYGDPAVHVLIDKECEYYVLEKLWSDGIITHLREPCENSLVLSRVMRSVSSSSVTVRRTSILRGASRGSLIVL